MPGSDGSSVSRHTVLYVGSDENRRNRTVRCLEGAAETVTVVAVPTVARAASTLERRDVDAVVLDCPLRETETASAVRSLRERWPSLPLVIYAPDGDARIAEEATIAGASAVVIGSAEVLTSQLRSHLRTLVDRTDRSDVSWRDVEALHQAALELGTCTERKDAYKLAVETAASVLDADATALYVERETPATSRVSTDLVPAAVVGAGDAERFVRSETSENVAQQTSLTGSAAAIDPRSFVEETDVRSILSVPVGSFGVLQAVSIGPTTFDDRDAQLVELLAVHLSETVTRLRSAEAFQQERDRFASLFESVPDAIVFTVTAESDTIVDVNEAFESVFGYEREEIVGESLNELIVPEGAEPVNIFEAVGHDGVVTTEVTRITADGPRDFLFRGFSIEIGDDLQGYCIYTDITEQKRRERDLERYRTLVDAVGDPMYVLDEEGRVEMANDALADSLGYTHAEVVGNHVSGFMPEEDVERGTRLIREILADPNRRWGTFETRIEPAEGDHRIVEDNVAPLVDEDGDFIGSVGAIRDITARKERESRIRALHDGTRQLMAAEDADEVATVASRIAADALDLRINAVHFYEPDEGGLVPVAFTDETAALLDEPPTIAVDGGLAWDAYVAGQPMAHVDVSNQPGITNPDTSIRSEAHLPIGEYGILIVSSTEPDDFDQEELALAKILASNVEAALDRAEREAELKDRRRELERQNDRLEQFAGTVSHDLRNPLTLASGHLDGARSLADDSVDDHLAEIEWALSRMDEIIDDVLVLARTGRQVADPGSVSLAEVVEQARRTVDPGLDVVVDEPPTVEGERNRLLVCFENLFRNALEHVGEDVTVTVGSTDDGGFYVADDGPGISEDERDTVFESGYTTDPEGTGFGLAIVSEVAEVHDWSVTITDAEGGGARFEFET